MNYNWGEPKKNTKLNAIMMTKAEASRKKRLSSVKSTLSNQLHAGTESKLRKKKAGPESARRDGSEVDIESARHTEPIDSGSNNHHHHHANNVADDDGPSASVGMKRATSSNNDFQSPEHDDSTSTSSSSSKATPIFGAFGHHAAAEGLFHPASTIAAFIEHDAKYNDKIGNNKPTSGRSALSSRSGSRASTINEYLPALASHQMKLPVVLNAKSRSRRNLLEQTTPSALASTRSDSDLHAPRKVGAVPSSADRNALDFYDHNDEDDDDGTDDDGGTEAAKRAKSSPSDLGGFALPSKLGKLGSSKSAVTLSAVRTANEDDGGALVKKFEDLKLLMHAKKKKSHAKPTGAVAPDSSTTSNTRAKPTQRKRHESSVQEKQGQQSSDAKTTAAAATVIEKSSSRTRIAKAPMLAATAGTSESKADAAARQRAPAVSTTPTASTQPVVMVIKTPPIKSRKEMKIRNGVSLSDLKEEHRAALEMLQELGGPMDMDYANHDEPDATGSARMRSKAATTRTTRSLKPSLKQPPPPPSQSKTKSSPVYAPLAFSSPRDLESPSSSSSLQQQTPSPGGSLVAKLRASVPSGRAKTPDARDDNALVSATAADDDKHSPQSDGPTALRNPTLAPQLLLASSTASTAAAVPTAAATDVVDSHSANAATIVALEISPQERSLKHVNEVNEEDDVAEVEANDGSSHRNGSNASPALPPAEVDGADLWKQYDDDGDYENDDSEGLGDEAFDAQASASFSGHNHEHLDLFTVAAAPTTPPLIATARSVDLYNDEGFESEW